MEFVLRFSMRLQLVIYLILFAICSSAQTMTVADSTYLANLRTQLLLTDQQFDTVQTVYLKAQGDIVKIDKEIRTISRSDLADSLKVEKSNALSLKKKNLREMLELDLQLLFTEEQKKLYAEKIKPSKPDISHFGAMHDRSKCVVCVPQKP